MKLKRHLLLGWLLCLALNNVPIRAHDISLTWLTLTGATAIKAGENWTVTVHADVAKPNPVIALTLLNGLREYDTNLTLDGNGTAQWTLPAGTLTAAGTSLVLAKYGVLEARFKLVVSPIEPTQIDALSTANTLTAYGTQCGAFVAVGQDHFGNPLDSHAISSLVLRSDSGNTKTIPLMFTGGLAISTVCSLGNPGKLFMTISTGNLNSTITLAQVPGMPAHVKLDVVPACVEQSQRDSLLVNLNAQITDEHGQPVSDGTQVRFEWDGGYGIALASNGRAILSIPYPSIAPAIYIKATAGEASSVEHTVRLAMSCTNPPQQLGHKRDAIE